MKASSFIPTVAAVVLTMGAGCVKSPQRAELAQEIPEETEPAPSPASGQMTRLLAKPGGNMRMEGTSSLHDWQVESKLLGGFLEVGKDFPTEPGQEVKPGKVEARAEAVLTVRSLHSIEKNGSRFSDKMDEIMWDKLRVMETPKIVYQASELVLKEAPKSKDAPYMFEAKGRLAVAGVTNTISMPVNVLPLGDNKLKITGTVPLKMSDFQIKPQTIGLGLFKTGDEVKLFFEWLVGPAKAPAAAAPR